VSARRYLSTCPPEAEAYCCATQCRYHARFADSGCALVVANDGEHTPQEIADILGISRDNVQDAIECGMRKMRTT
jgi:hypothetical protein